MLERRGLKYRDWAVEWEASAQEFLLEKGFSPEMGARPLKRAIDQYLIAPLAATIVERRFPEGDQFVFIRSDGRAIQVDFVDPDGELGGDPSSAGSGAPEKSFSLPEMILAPSGSVLELDALHGEHAELARTLTSAQWEDLKSALADRMSVPSFWTRTDRHDTLSRLALMDRVKAAAATANSLGARTRQGHRAHRQVFARTRGAPRSAAASAQRRHQGCPGNRADRGRTHRRAGIREAQRERDHAALVRAGARYVPGMGQQPAYAADGDIGFLARLALAADQRFRCSPPSGTGGRSARFGAVGRRKRVG